MKDIFIETSDELNINLEESNMTINNERMTMDISLVKEFTQLILPNL